MNIHPRDPRLDPRKAAAIQQARERYEASLKFFTKNRKAVASFDDLLDAYASECLTFTDIAVGLGVTKERVRQIYRDYFAHLFPANTGHKRRRVCTVARRSESRQTVTPNGVAAQVAREAERNGLATEAVPVIAAGNAYKGSTRHLRIEGVSVKCLFGSTHIMNADSLIGYYVFYRTPPRTRFVVMKLGEPRNSYFVMPSSTFLEWGGTLGRRVYIPARPCEYVPSMGITGWLWQYENAWHLLKATVAQ